MASTHELADRLHSAAIHLLRRVRKGDVATGVTPAQLSALSVLMSGPKTLGENGLIQQGILAPHAQPCLGARSRFVV